MNEADVLELARAAISTVLAACAPAVTAAVTVGLIVALLQALTQVQEATLTFVPKIVAVLLMLSATASYMGAIIGAFTQEIYARISTGF